MLIYLLIRALYLWYNGNICRVDINPLASMCHDRRGTSIFNFLLTRNTEAGGYGAEEGGNELCAWHLEGVQPVSRFQGHASA